MLRPRPSSASFKRICEKSSEHNGVLYISSLIYTDKQIFWQGRFFFLPLILSEYANKSLNFTNLNFLTHVTLSSLF